MICRLVYRCTFRCFGRDLFEESEDAEGRRRGRFMEERDNIEAFMLLEILAPSDPGTPQGKLTKRNMIVAIESRSLFRTYGHWDYTGLLPRIGLVVVFSDLTAFCQDFALRKDT